MFFSFLRQLKLTLYSIIGIGKKRLVFLPFNEKKIFDFHWYLTNYPDVKQSGMNPWEHYLKYGQYEGRTPCRNRSLSLDYHLWRGCEDIALPKLEKIAKSESLNIYEKCYACWALARWYFYKGNLEKALVYILHILEFRLFFYLHKGSLLLCLDLLLRKNRKAEAKIIFSRIENKKNLGINKYLVLANLQIDRSEKAQIKYINKLFKASSLAPIYINSGSSPLINRIEGSVVSRGSFDKSPKVSILIPSYNSVKTLPTAINSILNQTWRNLEVIIVDDCSHDNTEGYLDSLKLEIKKRKEISLVIIKNKKNNGTYSSRNFGLEIASGDLITVHDSDDWSHPQKIEKQVLSILSNEAAQASISFWSRCNESLHFSNWRIDDSLLHRNVSSLMFRREVLEKLGFWDSVLVNADTEYYYRIKAAFGNDSIVETIPECPLSFGRILANSLTQISSTHISSSLHGVRKSYIDAAMRWHKKASEVGGFYIAQEQTYRKFKAPDEIVEQDLPVKVVDPKDLMQQSCTFDKMWYINLIPSLLEQQQDLFEHFWEVGSKYGKDPNPNFSVSGYSYLFPECGNQSRLATLHFLTSKASSNYDGLTVIAGARCINEQWPTILLCGHQAGMQLFGAERSFIDVLKIFSRFNLNILVSLPEALNSKYIRTIKNYCSNLFIFPYLWWKKDVVECEIGKSHFIRILRGYKVDVCYINTSTIDLPAIAARYCGVKTIFHVREYPEGDKELCDLLAASPEYIRNKLLNLGDLIISNSKLVDGWINSSKSCVIPNFINSKNLKLLNNSHNKSQNKFTVALISSNLPKKGIFDFYEISKALYKFPIDFLLVGPDNHYVATLKKRAVTEKIDSIKFIDYEDDIEDIYEEIDILLNLSHFKESFGRTILEGMALGVPVIGYSWGAIPELIIDGYSGYLVDFGNTDMIASKILKIQSNIALQISMKNRSKVIVEERYNSSVVKSLFHGVLSKAFAEKI